MGKIIKRMRARRDRRRAARNNSSTPSRQINQQTRFATTSVIPSPATFDFNPLQFVTPKQPVDIITSQILDDDFIDIAKPTVSNTAFQDYELAHVATLRPEILAATELFPIYPDDAATGQNLTAVGKLITFKYQSQLMKSAILKALVESMTQNMVEPSSILKSFDDRFKVVSAVKNELGIVAQTQKNLKAYLNFRNFLNYNLTLEDEKLREVSSTFGLLKNGNDKVLPLQNFLQKLTGYNSSQYDSFTNTKIFMSVCSDLHQSLTDGVFGSLGQEVDQDRISDLSPTTVDTTHTTNSKLDVNVLNGVFGSTNQNLATQQVKFDRIQTTLSADPYQRFVLIMNFVTKELTYSRYLFELGKKTNTNVTGNFLQDLFGSPGATIFDTIVGDKSLISVASMRDVQRDSTILPFEDVYIENNTGNSQLSKKYIPGKRYFVDSILDGIATNVPDLNTKPLKDFADRTQTITADIKTVLDDIFKIKKSHFLYSGSQTYKYMLGQIDVSTAGLIKPNKTINEQAFAIALFRKCWEDQKLKLMVFQYLVYLGIYLRKVGQTQSQYIIFDTIANEVGSTDNLAFLKNPDLGSIAADSLTKNIQTISFTTTNQASISTMSQQLGIFARNIAKYVVRKEITTRQGKTVLASNQFSNYAQMRESTISEFLLSPTTSKTFITKGTLFFDFLDLVQNLDSITENGFFVTTGGTKFRGCQATTLVYLLFEAYISMSKIFGYADISLSTDNAGKKSLYGVYNCNVSVNWYKQLTVRQKIELLIGKNASVTDLGEIVNQKGTTVKNLTQLRIAGSNTATTKLLTYSDVADVAVSRRNSNAGMFADLYLLFGDGTDSQIGGDVMPKQGSKVYEVFKKLWDEDWYHLMSVSAYMNFLNNKILQPIKTNVDQLVQPTRLTTIRGTKLRPEVENLRIFDQAVTDFAVLRGAITDNPSKEEVVRFFERIATNPLKLQTMFSLFKEASFLPFGNPNETRKRVLTIGMPNGMIDSMNEKKLLSALNNQTTGRTFFTTQQGAESDIIQINVYRRDMRFEHLVFKPKTYLFDASLFMNELSWNDLVTKFQISSINPNSLTIDEIINKTKFFNYPERIAFNPNQVVSIDNGYATNLPRNKRAEVLRNTFQSYLLAYYLSLTTGMVIDEKTFTTGNDNEQSVQISLGSDFYKQVITYLRATGEPILDNNFASIQSNPDVSNQAKMLLELVNSVNVSTDPGMIYSRLVSNPVSFDRVFHIVETADAYEIDLAKTRSTRDGMNLLSSDKFNESLVKIGESYYLPFTGMDDVALSDYFVDIEVPSF